MKKNQFKGVVGMKEELLKRFTKYVKVDTQSNEESTACPTTPG